MKLIDEANNESWFKMPHALVDHAYPLLTGDAVKAHIVVTRWTHGLKNQRKTTTMTLGQVEEKTGITPHPRHKKAIQELKNLETNGLIKIYRSKGKTNRIELLRPGYKTLEERVKKLQNDAEVSPKKGDSSHNQVSPKKGDGVTPIMGDTLVKTITQNGCPSIDIDNIDTVAVEKDKEKDRNIRKENTKILMEIFESHMVHVNKYRKSKTGRRRDTDLRAFWEMLTIDRIDFNDIVEAIKYIYEGDGSWWASKIVNAGAFRKSFATIHGQVLQHKQSDTGIKGLA